MEIRYHDWDHFTRKIDFDGTSNGACNYCKKEYCVDSKRHGTIGMLTHLSNTKRCFVILILKKQIKKSVGSFVSYGNS